MRGSGSHSILMSFGPKLTLAIELNQNRGRKMESVPLACC